jgi:hypothetical protein
MYCRARAEAIQCRPEASFAFFMLSTQHLQMFISCSEEAADGVLRQFHHCSMSCSFRSHRINLYISCFVSHVTTVTVVTYCKVFWFLFWFQTQSIHHLCFSIAAVLFDDASKISAVHLGLTSAHGTKRTSTTLSPSPSNERKIWSQGTSCSSQPPITIRNVRIDIDIHCTILKQNLCCCLIPITCHHKFKRLWFICTWFVHWLQLRMPACCQGMDAYSADMPYATVS